MSQNVWIIPTLFNNLYKVNKAIYKKCIICKLFRAHYFPAHKSFLFPFITMNRLHALHTVNEEAGGNDMSGCRSCNV